MSRLWQTTGFELVLLGALLAILLVVGLYIVGKIREETKQSQLPSGEILNNFEELHARGQLNDQEFHTIRSMLRARMHDELKPRDGRREQSLPPATNAEASESSGDTHGVSGNMPSNPADH